MILPLLCNIEWINDDFSETIFSTRNLLIQRLLRYAVGTVYVLNIGFWRSPTIVFEVGFVKSDSKIVSWYQLALLAAIANSKTSWAKNNRPHQVKLENGRSWSQNDFRILESMLRGFIAPASRADVYTTSASASNVFVYTKTLFALQNACWAVPKPLVFCIRWMQAARLHRLR